MLSLFLPTRINISQHWRCNLSYSTKLNSHLNGSENGFISNCTFISIWIQTGIDHVIHTVQKVTNWNNIIDQLQFHLNQLFLLLYDILQKFWQQMMGLWCNMMNKTVACIFFFVSCFIVYNFAENANWKFILIVWYNCIKTTIMYHCFKWKW